MLENQKISTMEEKNKATQLNQESGTIISDKHGTFAIDAPTESDLALRNVKDDLTRNERRIRMRIAADQDFFIMGHAGWGKTQIIRSMAKRMGRTVITVYLDKAVKEDLGGIPVPVKTDGHAAIELAMPAWAAYMLQHKDEQFLLFLDEMNQADPGVQNALMPIIDEKVICNVKFDNYIVGAAGNYADENRAVTDLSTPLVSRFGGIMLWDDNNKDSWADVFKYLHKKWDELLGKDFVDLFESNSSLFRSPREVEKKIFNYIYKLKQNGLTDDFTADDYKDELELVSREDLERADRDKGLYKLAEYMYKYMIKGTEADKPRERTKDRGQLPKYAIKAFRFGMPNGYIQYRAHDYIFTHESCYYIAANLPAEDVERLIQMMEAEGLEFKYETDAEAMKNPILKDMNRIMQ